MWKHAKKRERKKLISVTYEKPIQHKIFIKLKIKTAFLLADYNGFFYESRVIGKMCATKRVYDNTFVRTNTRTYEKISNSGYSIKSIFCQ